MAADGSATVFCFAPRRVPVTERLKGPASSTAGAIPGLAPGPCPVCPLLAEKVEASRQATSWRVMHRRAVAREDHLKQRVAELEAKRRWREQQLFGRKTETAAATVPEVGTDPEPAGRTATGPARARPSGLQPAAGHGRASRTGRRGVRLSPVPPPFRGRRRCGRHHHPGDRGPRASPARPPTPLSSHRQCRRTTTRRHARNADRSSDARTPTGPGRCGRAHWPP